MSEKPENLRAQSFKLAPIVLPRTPYPIPIKERKHSVSGNEPGSVKKRKVLENKMDSNSSLESY